MDGQRELGFAEQGAGSRDVVHCAAEDGRVGPPLAQVARKHGGGVSQGPRRENGPVLKKIDRQYLRSLMLKYKRTKMH